jgi:hypothetical protein
MGEFERFIRWARLRGHYQTVTAINSYLNIPEEDRERASYSKEDYRQIELRRSQCTQPDNCE